MVFEDRPDLLVELFLDPVRGTRSAKTEDNQHDQDRNPGLFCTNDEPTGRSN